MSAGTTAGTVLSALERSMRRQDYRFAGRDTEKMTEEEIATIESRVAEIAEGPWFFLPARKRQDGTLMDFTVAYGVPGVASETYDLLDRYEEADYRFMAESRQNVPALIAEVRRLQTQLSEWRKASEELALRAAWANRQGVLEIQALRRKYPKEIEQIPASAQPTGTGDQEAGGKNDVC
jgi:hypothetical protein